MLCEHDLSFKTLYLTVLSPFQLKGALRGFSLCVPDTSFTTIRKDRQPFGTVGCPHALSEHRVRVLMDPLLLWLPADASWEEGDDGSGT